MIALTGSTGFLGSYISDSLPFPQKRLTRQAKVGKEWIQGDIRNKQDIEKLISGAETLVHFACTSHPRTSNVNIVEDIEHNLISTIHLFEMFAEMNPKGHIIFSSTGGNMYDGQILEAKTEEHLPYPRSGYGIIKLTIEHYLRQFCEQKQICATIFRISNPYGKLLSHQRAQGLIGVAFAKLLADEELHLYDSLETVRDYLHLDDLVTAYQLAIKRPPHQGECRMFNIGSNRGYSTGEVLNLIETTTNKKIKRKKIQSDISPTINILSYRKIENQLGWKPTIELHEGIAKLWKSIQKNEM